MHADHHHHPPRTTDYHRAFAVGVILNLGFVAVEAAYGVIAGSLALLADAGHNLGDVAGLALAWGASYLSRRKPTDRRTYGWRRSSILAALANAFILMAAVGGIAWEAVRRLQNPGSVVGATVMVVAGVGVAVNTATAFLFAKDRKTDLNLRGAFLHMAADAMVSLGVVAAGLAIFYTGWFWLDPVVSLVISVIIFMGTWGLLRDSLNLAMDAVPAGIDLRAVEAYLTGLPGVSAIHDLHIWALSTTEVALTAHLVKPDATGDDDLIAQVQHDLYTFFNITHPTLQLERGSIPYKACGLDTCHRSLAEGEQ